MTEPALPGKGAEAYRTIGEVAEELKLPQHVLRFWETRFPQIKPLKRAGGRRFYRPEDLDLLRAVKSLLYGEGYTIKGVQRLLQEQGHRGVSVDLPRSDRTAKPESPLGVMTCGPGFEERGPLDRDLEDDPRRVVPSSDISTTRGLASIPQPPSSATSASPVPTGPDLVARLKALARELVDCAGILDAARRG